jgi:phenylalanyl-tRNA synthetase beta chain
MLIESKALIAELPALKGTPTVELCELLAGLGFPVDGVDMAHGDPVLEVDITANRGDAQSHRGMARDLAAKLGAALSLVPVRVLTEGQALLPVHLEAGTAAPFYATAILELGAGTTTPAPVQAFLGALGATAKGLPAVDASNELLHRYGHPTHAFDADKVQGGLTVRWARAGETLVTLDAVERKLTAKDLVIADQGGPIALAGVMGGDGTKVTAATRRVLLESAFFDARTVRAMAHRHGVHTDASHRFGRGADPAQATVSRDLLVQRLEDWASARLVSAWSVGTVPAVAGAVELPWAMVDRVAGHAVEQGETAELLRRLGCQVTAGTLAATVVPPTWRSDLGLPEDLAEEVLRLRGYEKIPSVLPPLESSPQPLAPDYLKRRKLASRLANLGFFQTVTLGFGDPLEDKEGHGVGDNPEGRTLRNPLGEDYSLMRGTLLRDLGKIARMNLERGAKEVRLFEIAPLYQAGRGGGLTETWTLGMIWGGQLGGDDPLTGPRKIGEPEGKSYLIGILKALGVEDTTIKAFKRWEMAGLETGAKGQAGWQFELPLAGVPDEPERVIPRFTPFSRFPAVERDLSLLVGLDQSYAALQAAMAKATGEAPLQDLRCVDVFRHKSLPQGRQAWLMRLRFQAMDRTLTGEEVDAWVVSCLNAAKSLGAELRG